MIAETGATAIAALQQLGDIVWMVRDTLFEVIGPTAPGRVSFPGCDGKRRPDVHGNPPPLGSGR
jgi:hypothetical protein